MRVEEDVKREAARCLGCKNAPCRAACPVGTDIPAFLRRLAQDDGKGAAEILLKNNVFSAVCGLVCPRERQCEGHCVRGIKGQCLAIGKLENYAAANFSDDFSERDNRLQGKKVAVVGGGVAGVTAATILAGHGASVTVSEKYREAGGVPVYGIPPFRLPRETVRDITQRAARLGVAFRFEETDGEQLRALSSTCDAVFLSCGLQREMTLNVAGEDKKGVLFSAEYLKEPQNGKNVLVIGGGNVAMDCARTALRTGAEVTVVYRRTATEMPAFDEEKNAAEQEGVRFRYLLAPEEITGGDNVDGMVFRKMRLTDVGADGRRGIEPTEERETLSCDTVVVAVGSRVDEGLLAAAGIRTERGKVIVDESMFTGQNNVFAGGDVTNREQTVVAAVRDGKKAAAAIADYLTAGDKSEEKADVYR